MSSPPVAPIRQRTVTVFRSAGWSRVVPFLAYFLLFGAWALAIPYNGSPDEVAHIWHAYGVASGDVVPESTFRGAIHEVPRSLPEDRCFALQPQTSADCGGREPGGDESLDSVYTYTGRYNPVYYLITGWPLVISPDMVGVLGARLVSAAMAAALFGWATLVALSLRRRGALAGLVVALTPITAHLAGAVNPNAVEIAAGAGLVTAMIAILFDAGSGSSRSPWWLAGVCGGVMLTVRAAGPLWFAIVVAVLLIPLSLARYRALAGDRRVRRLAVSWLVVGLAGVGWTLWRRSYEILPAPEAMPLGMGKALKIEFLVQLPQLVYELVGVMGWLDTQLPIVVHLAWWLSVGTLGMVAIAVGRPADRWRVVGLGGLGLLVPMFIEVINVNKYGFLTQGRYLLPMLVGVPILAGHLLADRIPFDLSPRLTRLFAIILLPMHLGALCYTMIRYQRGIPIGDVPSLDPISGSWQPFLGSVLPVAVALASAILFIVFYHRVTAVPAADRISVERSVPPIPAERDPVAVILTYGRSDG